MSPDKGLGREHLFAGILKIYLYYRFLLALTLFGAFLFDIGNNVFGNTAPNIYTSTIIVYVVVSALSLGFYQLQRQDLKPNQLLLNLVADIAIQTLLMFCSGGLISGLGYLMLVTVTLGAIFFTGQLAVLIPAIASICIILESILSSYLFDQNSVNIFPAGVLGVLLFATALVFSRLSDALVVAQKTLQSETAYAAGLQELNHLIIDRMRTGIIVVDEQSIIQQINQAARELLGRLNKERPLKIGDNIGVETRLLKRLQSWRKTPSQKTDIFIPRFGSTEVQATFANLETGNSEKIIIFLEDYRTKTQEAQQLKLASLGRLTGSIAHEIRNPLGAISHASELLNEIRQEDPTATRLTEIINNHVKRVNHIVESVMQLSRKQSHNPQKLKLVQWLKNFLDDYKLGGHRDATIELNANNTQVTEITFDPIHLQQILTNLLDNALRHSNQQVGEEWAGIVVNLEESTGLISVDVTDKGPGVPPDQHNQLFEPFFSTSTGGSGLGLYLARELCAINYASLKYQITEDSLRDFFRITFIHPNKILNLPEDSNDSQ